MTPRMLEEEKTINCMLTKMIGKSSGKLEQDDR